jgi:uncharacterized protein (TIGR00299 family) protein
MATVLYFDAFNGIAGDMILGALLDLGLPFELLNRELAKLGLQGYELCANQIDRQGLFGIDLKVVLSNEEDDGHHQHHHEPHDGAHRHGPRHHNYREIRELIEASELKPEVRVMAISIFRKLAEAEASVHQSTVDDVHFHEVGALDSLVDIVGACIGFDFFGVDEFYCSNLNLGSGTVTFSHGTWPIPAPATAKLLHGFACRLDSVEAELTTPTGAAVVSALVDPTEDIPVIQFEKWGFGAGDRELPGIPNMLRLGLGEKPFQASAFPPFDGACNERVLVLETNIDNMDPETLGHILGRVLNEGALDAYFTPIQMKKNRPGVQLSILCHPRERDRMLELVFNETTTLGVRSSLFERYALERDVHEVETEFGLVRFKISKFRGKVVNVTPEYDDLKRIASETGLPLKEIRQTLRDRSAELQS